MTTFLGDGHRARQSLELQEVGYGLPGPSPSNGASTANLSSPQSRPKHLVTAAENCLARYSVFSTHWSFVVVHYMFFPTSLENRNKIETHSL